MINYPKIETLLNRDPGTHRVIKYQWRLPEFQYLKDNDWLFTEKMDGCNVRIMWDGESVSFSGRTDRSMLQKPLLDMLQERFVSNMFAGLFNHPACLFGEGIGRGIQKVGKYYNPNGVDFVLFDVIVRAERNWWLRRRDVEEIAAILGCDVVPVVGVGSLLDAINLVEKGFNSRWGDFLAEGLVVRPVIDLYDHSGKPIMGKIKHKDFGGVV